MFKKLLSQTIFRTIPPGLLGTVVLVLCVLGMWLMVSKQLTILTELETVKRDLGELERQITLDKLVYELNDLTNVTYTDTILGRMESIKISQDEVVDEYTTVREEDPTVGISVLHDKLWEFYKTTYDTNTVIDP